MTAVTAIMPAIESAAREQLVRELADLQAKMLKRFNVQTSVDAHVQLAALLTIFAAREMHDEALAGEPLSDAERWAIFERLLGRDMLDLARDSARRLLQLKEATEANG